MSEQVPTDLPGYWRRHVGKGGQAQHGKSERRPRSGSTGGIFKRCGKGAGADFQAGGGAPIGVRCETGPCRNSPKVLLRHVHTGMRSTNRDYLFDAFADSLCGAFFCNTRTRCCPDGGIEALPPRMISRAVILRP
jgi:hypothetical protein